MAIVRPDGTIFWFFHRLEGYHVVEWQSHDIGKSLADLPFRHLVFRTEVKDARKFTSTNKAVSDELLAMNDASTTYALAGSKYRLAMSRHTLPTS
jgi:hypothetical protein